MYHRHVSLIRDNERRTCWIPEEFARLGRRLQIKIDDEWSDGWVVAAVFTRMPSTYITTHARDYVHQREASDI